MIEVTFKGETIEHVAQSCAQFLCGIKTDVALDRPTTVTLTSAPPEETPDPVGVEKARQPPPPEPPPAEPAPPDKLSPDEKAAVVRERLLGASSKAENPRKFQIAFLARFLPDDAPKKTVTALVNMGGAHLDAAYKAAIKEL